MVSPSKSFVAVAKAVLLDRDGTIIVDHGYMHDPAQLEFLLGAVEALRELSERGYLLIVITNQSGIARGYFTQAQYELFDAAFVEALREQGVEIAGSYMCPHAPGDGCCCRKPYPYMALAALSDFGVDAAESYMFGDKLSDVECGEAAGLTSRQIVEGRDLLFWTHEIIENKI